MMSFTHVLYAKQICEHISLKYGITLKRYSFIYGSVKPDVSILFLGKTKHYFDVSLDMVTESANVLINAINSEKEIETKAFARELGVIMHYITDFFCRVHNDINGIKHSENFRHVLYEQRFQKVLEEYYELKQKFESDPLSISWQLDKDSETNLEKGLTEESLSSLSQLGTIAYDTDTGVSWASIEDLIKKADEAGMDVKNLRVQLDELVAAGKLINLNITETDPLGLQSMQSDAETTITYLEAMGIKIREWSGAFTIDLPSFIDLMVAAGWSSERISAYISELNGNGYTFTFTTEENKVETLDVNTQEGQAKVDELVTTSDTLTDTEILTVNINGTAEGALKAMKANLASMTSTDHKISIYQTTYKNTVDNGSGSVNSTAHASGTAHANGSWGAPRTETALVGELGPELLVRGNRWTTIGENGTEFTQIKKGDIIFNH